jgi:hypothetical protein
MQSMDGNQVPPDLIEVIGRIHRDEPLADAELVSRARKLDWRRFARADGHHKLEAAAMTGRSMQLLTLVAIDASLASQADILRLPSIRAQAASQRH